MHWFHKTSITAMPDYVKWNTKKKIISKCYFLILIKNPKSDIRRIKISYFIECTNIVQVRRTSQLTKLIPNNEILEESRNRMNLNTSR